MGRKKLSIHESFFRHIKKCENGCWEWQGYKNAGGYGFIIKSAGPNKMIRAHRASWQIHNGPIPEGMFICHKCDNPSCVNPDHLFVGSCADNVKDSMNKGRFAKPGQRRQSALKHSMKGEKHCCAKLTDMEVALIKNLKANGLTGKELALRFNVSPSTICDITKGRTRKSISGVLNG